jgi:hypothetical protein
MLTSLLILHVLILFLNWIHRRISHLARLLLSYHEYATLLIFVILTLMLNFPFIFHDRRKTHVNLLRGHRTTLLFRSLKLLSL